MFGRAAITLGIGPHSSCFLYYVTPERFLYGSVCTRTDTAGRDSVALQYKIIIVLLLCKLPPLDIRCTVTVWPNGDGVAHVNKLPRVGPGAVSNS